MTLQAGDKAPAFTLFNTEKKEVSLSDFAGKNLVIHFFPQAFTGTCTTQLCTVRDTITTYETPSSDVVGISVDSLFTLAKFKEEQRLPFQLLSDFNKETSAAYGALYDTFVFNMKGVSKRAAFVIDKNGVVQYAQVLESAGDLPDFQAIEATLARLNA